MELRNVTVLWADFISFRTPQWSNPVQDSRSTLTPLDEAYSGGFNSPPELIALRMLSLPKDKESTMCHISVTSVPNSAISLGWAYDDHDVFVHQAAYADNVQHYHPLSM